MQEQDRKHITAKQIEEMMEERAKRVMQHADAKKNQNKTNFRNFAANKSRRGRRGR